MKQYKYGTGVYVKNTGRPLDTCRKLRGRGPAAMGENREIQTSFLYCHVRAALSIGLCYSTLPLVPSQNRRKKYPLKTSNAKFNFGNLRASHWAARVPSELSLRGAKREARKKNARAVWRLEIYCSQGRGALQRRSTAKLSKTRYEKTQIGVEI